CSALCENCRNTKAAATPRWQRLWCLVAITLRRVRCRRCCTGARSAVCRHTPHPPADQHYYDDTDNPPCCCTHKDKVRNKCLFGCSYDEDSLCSSSLHSFI